MAAFSSMKNQEEDEMNHSDMSLPTGWEVAWTESGKKYYIE
jgi:hypothetical protein